MRRRFAVVAAVVLGIVFCSGAAEAGWVVRGQHKSDGGERVDKETTYFDRSRVRNESDGQASVMDFKARRILWIDTKRKAYSSMTFDEFKKMMRENMARANEAMEEMRKAGVTVPGQPSRPRGKVVVTRIEGATVAGFACDGYRVTVGGTETEKIWIARKFAPITEFEGAWAREFEELMKEFRRMGMMQDAAEEDPAVRKVYESGYPMRIVDKPDRTIQEVTSVEKKSLDAALFSEPTGYRKEKFGEMMGGAGDEEAPVAGKGKGKPGTARPRMTAPPSGDGMESPPSGGSPGRPAADRATDYGKQSVDEAAEAAKEGAARPFEEKKSDGLGTIKEGVSEGVRKLFKW